MRDWNDLKELKDIDFYINTILYHNHKMLDLKKYISNSDIDDIDLDLGKGAITDTITMLKYISIEKDCCKKAYVLQSILDKVQDMYFDTLKEVEKKKPIVKRLGKYMVVTGVDVSDNIEFAKVMNDIFMNSDDYELRVLAGEWIFKNIFGKKIL